MAARVNPEVDVAKLLSGLYLPETTFASRAVKIDDKTAIVTHTLTGAQCAPRKTAMLRGVIKADVNTITNTRRVDDEITKGHFRDFRLLAGHQGFGMLLAAGSYNHPVWWTEISSISWQSPAVPEDEMIATVTITQNGFNGKVMRGGSTHTQARGIRLEDANPADFSGFHLPQNAWLEVGAHFGGGAIAACGEFPGKDFAPIYLGVGQSNLPKESGLPGDELTGTVTLNSIEYLDIPGLGQLKVISVNADISKGTSGKWHFSELEFGFALKERLLGAIGQR